MLLGLAFLLTGLVLYTDPWFLSPSSLVFPIIDVYPSLASPILCGVVLILTKISARTLCRIDPRCLR